VFAINTQNLLMHLSEKCDAFGISADEITKRFESLRSYGRIPRGRANRGKLLTPNEIAATILGLVPAHPAWAGHGAIVLSGLRVMGGAEAFSFGTSTLQETIAYILSNKAVRNTVIRLEVSLAESGTNSHGYASLCYRESDVRRRAFFTPWQALTAAPAQEESFEQIILHAPVCREMAFNRAFFDRIAQALERASVSAEPPPSDGSEYDNEEAREERYRRLGVISGSRFLNIGVENQVTWPRTETLVKFDRYQFVLMPKTKDHVQSIHILISRKIGWRTRKR
jgi:hypothetical protein